MNNLTIEEVFEAYYECRKTKRYSYGALSVEYLDKVGLQYLATIGLDGKPKVRLPSYGKRN